MKTIDQINQDNRIIMNESGIDGGCARAYLTRNNPPVAIIYSWGGYWDHVSVSFRDRCPTWEEMCQVKDIFFNDDECVVQYHPPKNEYVNNHPYCLHLWKWQKGEFPKPSKEFV